jgi:hypothetical protein
MTRTVGRCFWALPTLSLPAPEWTAYVAAEWCCYADGPAEPLDDARVCQTCGRWSDREPARTSPKDRQPKTVRS